MKYIIDRRPPSTCYELTGEEGYSALPYLRQLFQLMVYKTKKVLQQRMNERFKYVEFYVFFPYVEIYRYTVEIRRILSVSCYAVCLTRPY